MYKVDIGKASLAVSVKDGVFTVDGQPMQWDCIKTVDNNFHVLHHNKSYLIQVEKADYMRKVFSIRINGLTHEVKVYSSIDLIALKMDRGTKQFKTANFVKAPMPGLILDIKVKTGEKVKAGDSLLVLEAMKMENTLKAPYDGIIKKIRAKRGEGVEKGQILIDF